MILLTLKVVELTARGGGSNYDSSPSGQQGPSFSSAVIVGLITERKEGHKQPQPDKLKNKPQNKPPRSKQQETLSLQNRLQQVKQQSGLQVQGTAQLYLETR